ncbi:Zinc dependent phospholipase C [Candidatus Methanoperedens nitroreducens]|uniref:Zinc dependent phospholipase C n=1 Tax=Candidatus Methanoperedens nitratireducens TaxID=1392998 RepID=A0A062V375_9EURY|nr:hypothetical protein [Candidatus Methanoperedens nitroreducens]KCZ71058.1 Zinc dependent phospholipase C [Candidatus Methanoperedens nitroreducens]
MVGITEMRNFTTIFFERKCKPAYPSLFFVTIPYYNLEHTEALDDAASRRAQEEYNKSLQALRNGDYRLAAFYAGTMSHYISDVAVWAHVRGRGSPHGSEDIKDLTAYRWSNFCPWDRMEMAQTSG